MAEDPQSNSAAADAERRILFTKQAFDNVPRALTGGGAVRSKPKWRFPNFLAGSNWRGEAGACEATVYGGGPIASARLPATAGGSNVRAPFRAATIWDGKTRPETVS
jgi:hypothetical protein